MANCYGGVILIGVIEKEDGSFATIGLKDADKIIMENSGYIRIGKNEMFKGGISEPRNKALMKMFNLNGIDK